MESEKKYTLKDLDKYFTIGFVLGALTAGLCLVMILAY
jgi:hypothetical protein